MSANEQNSAGVALIFGGSRGIGAAIATRLAQAGYRVALTYVSRPDKAHDVAATIAAEGGEAVAIEADSSDPGAIRAAVAGTIERFGRLDVAVVNAGVLRLGTIDELSLEDLDLTLAVNVRGVFLAIQAAATEMQDGGRIITIGSNAAKHVVRGSSIYAMSKAAVATMVKGIALDLAPRGITVNNIQPGPTETDMTASMVSDLAAMVPIGRVGQGAEIAELALYLAGPQSGYMTGSSLTIDGGFAL
ncbi:SDR family NAD(P)-dependent oxidoreductase [Aurantimonas sp. VKM B-3413]|uniref:SDR family NAD(P)-dependent oxidoreductase n=1 Tax=Aurantimonas sp. VKM B-3413 TaxID=2779401 RepID=UPI001E5A64EB|nr:SDR family oxidoreductase [Aurantimonas sp. VKM B-3413]MCB8840210.1 SDR family oxidoreductase [Aurantimonas sp. VKM B-3413]